MLSDSPGHRMTTTWILRVLRSAPRLTAVMVVLTAGSGVLAAAPAFFFSRLVDDVTKRSTVSMILWSIVILIASYAVGTAVSYLSGMAGIALSNRASIDLELTLTESIANKPGVKMFDDPTMQGQITEAQDVALQWPDTVTDVVISLIASVLTLATYATVLAKSWPWMGIILLVTVFPMVAIQGKANQVVRSTGRSALHSSRWRDYFFETLRSAPGSRELRLLGFGGRLSSLVVRHHKSVCDRELTQQRTSSRAQVSATGLNQLVLAAGLLFIGISVSRGHGSPGTLVLFFTAVVSAQSQLLTAIMTTGRVASMVQFLRSFDLVTAPVLDADVSGPSSGINGDIEFEKVSFRYREDLPWVLQDVSFTITEGSFVTLAGANGCGKSTLMALLLKLYEPTGGRITLGGQDIKYLSSQEYRSQFTGIVQGFQELEMTLQQNCMVASEDFDAPPSSRADICELLDLDRIASKLSHGWDTVLTRERVDDSAANGGALSGGEWQRVAWARALAKSNYAYIVVDEGTSMMDPTTEERLTGYLLNDCRHLTRIVVAHRPAQALAADVVVLIAEGRIIGEISRRQDADQESRLRAWFKQYAPA